MRLSLPPPSDVKRPEKPAPVQTCVGSHRDQVRAGRQVPRYHTLYQDDFLINGDHKDNMATLNGDWLFPGPLRGSQHQPLGESGLLHVNKKRYHLNP